jgi:general secretion pathway protein G
MVSSMKDPGSMKDERAVDVAAPAVEVLSLAPAPSSFRAAIRRGRRIAQRGFTLIELMVVVTIIGILAAVAIANVKYAQQKARESALRDDLYEMRKAIDSFYADKQRYPADLNELTPGYMRKVPVDPITKAADWEQVPADTSDPQIQSDQATSGSAEGAAAAPGIQDVKTKAQGKTLDGVAYSDL